MCSSGLRDTDGIQGILRVFATLCAGVVHGGGLSNKDPRGNIATRGFQHVFREETEEPSAVYLPVTAMQDTTWRPLGSLSPETGTWQDVLGHFLELTSL